MTDMIGDLLRASMLEQLGDDEQRVERLRQAAHALTDRLTVQDRSLLPAALLTAINSSSSADAPMLCMAREALLEVWETLGHAYPDEPVELYRAVLLDAAATGFTKDEDSAAAGWYTLRTAAEQLPVGRWEPVLRKLLQDWDTAVGPVAEQRWVTERSRARRAKKAPSPTQAPIGLESDASQRAANIVSSGNWQTAAQLLVQELPALVNELIEAAETAAATALRRSGEEMEKLLASRFDELGARLEAQLRAARAAELRSQLLWWHSTGYSISRHLRYKELTPDRAAVTAALDVHHLVDGLCPVSVEHVLHDTVEAAVNRDVTLNTLASCDWSAEMTQDVEPAEGTILRAVARGHDTPLSDRDAPLRPARAAVLLFRDLQAACLLAGETS